MTEGLKLVIVGGLLLIAVAVVSGGIYTAHTIDHARTFVLNRLTGVAWVCRQELNWKCLPAGEAPPKVPLDLTGLKPLNPFDQFDTPAKGDKP
jgi:hypothetical protein